MSQSVERSGLDPGVLGVPNIASLLFKPYLTFKTHSIEINSSLLHMFHQFFAFLSTLFPNQSLLVVEIKIPIHFFDECLLSIPFVCRV